MATQAKLSTLAHGCLLPFALNFLEHWQSLPLRVQELTLLSELAEAGGVEGLALSCFVVQVHCLHLALAVSKETGVAEFAEARLPVLADHHLVLLVLGSIGFGVDGERPGRGAA